MDILETDQTNNNFPQQKFFKKYIVSNLKWLKPQIVLISYPKYLLNTLNYGYMVKVATKVSPHLTDRHLSERLNVQSLLDRTDI